MSTAIVDELVTLLGFRVDPTAHPTLTKFNEAMGSITKLASMAAVSVTAAATSLLYFAEKSAMAGAEIERFHELTGMSTDSIQQWGYAAQQVSGNKESILQDIQKMTISLNPILPSQFNQGLFLLLRTKLKEMKNVNQLFTELSKIFSHMAPEKAMQWGNMIGISPETVLLLRTGKLDQLFDRAKKFNLSPGEAKESLKFAQMWKDLTYGIERFSEKVAVKLFPVLEKVIGKFEQWYFFNEKLISSDIQRFIDGISQGVERFIKGLDRIKEISPFVKGLFDLILDPRIIGGAVATALTGIAIALGIIAAKYVLIGGVILAAIGALDAFNDPESWVNRKRWEEYSSRPDLIKKYTPKWATPDPPPHPNAAMPQGPLDSLRAILNGANNINTAEPTSSQPMARRSSAESDTRSTGSTSVQHNQNVTIHIDAGGQTTYAVSDEAIRKLDSIPRTDFRTMSPVAPVN